MRTVNDGRECHDEWRLLADDEPLVEASAVLPLARWLAASPAQGMSPYGLWVHPQDELAAVLGVAARCVMIAIDFPTFNDGRGYSFARQLRAAGFAGDLRAVGDVLRDQAFYLARCGFSSFEPAAHIESSAFIAGLKDFSLAYQGAADGRTIIQRLRHAR